MCMCLCTCVHTHIRIKLNENNISFTAQCILSLRVVTVGTTAYICSNNVFVLQLGHKYYLLIK